MKKFLVLALGLLTASALTVSAAEKKEKKPLTEEQQKLMKELVEKYDTNKNGNLDADELAPEIHTGNSGGSAAHEGVEDNVGMGDK